jgi:hypothetical protein
MKLQYRHENNHLWYEQRHRCLHVNSHELLLNQKLQVPTAILKCSSHTFPHDIATSSKASVHTYQTKQHHVSANIPDHENPKPHTQPQHFMVLKHISQQWRQIIMHSKQCNVNCLQISSQNSCLKQNTTVKSEVLTTMTLKMSSVGSPGILVNFYQAHPVLKLEGARYIYGKLIY